MSPGFWHFDAQGVVIIGGMLFGAAKMFWTLREHVPHSHLDSRGKRARMIADTVVIYPKEKE
jgi:hypothetical protein